MKQITLRRGRILKEHLKFIYIETHIKEDDFKAIIPDTSPSIFWTY
jgi:hypothetical protein